MTSRLVSPAAAAALSGATARAAIGAAFHFDTGVQYYLRSMDSRVDPNGIEWRAGATLVSISGLQFGIGRRTENVTLEMPGLSFEKLNKILRETGNDTSFFDLAKSQAIETHGRKIEFFLHTFDSEWQYVEAPKSLGVYLMDRLTPVFEGEGPKATVRLTCEPIGVSKFRAPNGYLDTRDQQIRHPGDKALDLMAKYVVNQTMGPW